MNILNSLSLFKENIKFAIEKVIKSLKFYVRWDVIKKKLLKSSFQLFNLFLEFFFSTISKLLQEDSKDK